MSRIFLGGFVLIASVAVGAVDYINQARRAGVAPGAFAASDYIATIAGRATGRPPAPSAGVAAAGAEPGQAPPAMTAEAAVAEQQRSMQGQQQAQSLAALARAAMPSAEGAGTGATLPGTTAAGTAAQANAALAAAAAAIAAGGEAAPQTAQPAASFAPPQGGGLTAMLGGFFGGGPASAPQGPAAKPTVGIGGAGNCAVTGSIKRCSLAGN